MPRSDEMEPRHLCAAETAQDTQPKILAVQELLAFLTASVHSDRLERAVVAASQREKAAPKRVRVAQQNESTVVRGRGVWLSGRLEPLTSCRTATTLALCGGDVRVVVSLIDPHLTALYAMVLVKSWTFVSDTGSLDLSSGFLEIDDTVGPEQPETTPVIQPEHVWEKLLHESTIQDAPLFTQEKPWALATRDTTETTKTTAKKKPRRFHAVFGRITSVSPVAMHRDAKSSHFFVEIASVNDGALSAVNVLLSGSKALAWRPFLRPGLDVVLTNLKKLYSQECEQFLLSASLSSSDAVTEIVTWRRNDPIAPAVKTIRDVPMGSSFEGVVVDVWWDECLVVEDGAVRALIALFHFPSNDWLGRLRHGTRVHVDNVHVLDSTAQHVVLGLCARSSLRVVRHAQLTAPLLRAQSLKKLALSKKWSIFGDFLRQPLVESMWWLQTFHSLVQKFAFGSDANLSKPARYLSFWTNESTPQSPQLGIGSWQPLESFSQLALASGAEELTVAKLQQATTEASESERSMSVRELFFHADYSESTTSIHKSRLVSIVAVIQGLQRVAVATTRPLLSQLRLTRLGAMYRETAIDRTWHRLVVRVVHVSYVVLKRKCSTCKQTLRLIRHQGLWTHDPDGEASLRTMPTQTPTPAPRCRWRHLQHISPVFGSETFVSASMRCIIDDGSAQAEMFLEREAVWELLVCSAGQRRHFEEVVTTQLSELSHFATRHDTLFTTKSTQDSAYYHNDWRAFVSRAVPATQSIAVIVQRFFARQQPTALETVVLPFGRDLQLTTRRRPMLQLEARRVDVLSSGELRQELRQRLQSSMEPERLATTEAPSAATAPPPPSSSPAERTDVAASSAEPPAEERPTHSPPAEAEAEPPMSTATHPPQDAPPQAGSLAVSVNMNGGLHASAVQATPTAMQAALSSTLTPVGEEAKVTAAPQRAKDAKASKKADAADAAPAKAPKKASPRVRAPATKAPSKAEKRKASPARSNAAAAAATSQPGMPATSMPTATTAASAPATTAAENPTVTSAPMGSMGPMAPPQELPPAQDNELRKACLQGVYRKLQSMLPNQDDAFIRRLATNVEIDVCRRVTTRNPSQSPYDKPQHQFGSNPESSAAMNLPYQPQSGRQSPFAPPASAGGMYPTSSQMPQASTVGTTDSVPGSDPYSAQRAAAAAAARMQAQSVGLQEFAAQFQHFDKNALIELLWNQRTSLMQWQRRFAQLEMQLNSRQQYGAPPSGMPTGAGVLPASFYNASPRPTYPGGVPPSTSAEAEAQRTQKAENVKHNISLAIAILQEQPTNVQPRPLEVLASIERFIHSTVVPIVRKVHPQLLAQGPPAQSPQGYPGQYTNSLMSEQPGSGNSPVPTSGVNSQASSAMGAPAANLSQPGQNGLPGKQPPKGAAAKSAGKSGGRKSPTNGTKRATPKNGTKAAGKKSPARLSPSGASSQAPTESFTNETPSMPSMPPSGLMSLSERDLPAMKDDAKSESMPDDDCLNDFADFDIEFSDDPQDPLAKIQFNKENATGNDSRKRSIEDV
ncbi:hypothetical protein ATCC90586_008555 [Pythium insidiosum]|nr:hypothetical protein ATCC90586_008555 [Pythium insidiosum]